MSAPALTELRHAHPARGIHAPALLERFFISGVVAVLLIRVWLQLTGYPQIGGDGLHIAHMLFGGAAMLVALLASLTFLGPRTRNLVAVVGGAGFGTFIDELGKFITSDNDYFYRPTVSLIYVIFVLLFIAGERLAHEVNPTEEERLAQALDVTTGAVIEHFPASERDLAMRLLAECNPASPLVPALQKALSEIAAGPDPPDGWVERFGQRVTRFYARLTGQRWFLKMILVLGTITTFFYVFELSSTLLVDPGSSRFRAYIDSMTGLLLLANLIAAAFLITGLLHLRISVLAAFQWFRRWVLVSLLLVQPLEFYQEEWTALIGLALSLLLLSALEFAIAHEAPLPGTADDATPMASGPGNQGRR